MKAEVLEAIIRFADHAHGEQRRKYSEDRYIVHPVRVMQTCQQYTNDVSVLAAAVLHDVLEDTPVGREDILEFLRPVMGPDQAERALYFVIELTDVYIKSKYPGLNRAQRKEREARRLWAVSAESQTVKYADIMDNAVEVVLHDAEFGYRYLTEAMIILQGMSLGNAVLYQRAIHTVKEGMEKVRKTI